MKSQFIADPTHKIQVKDVAKALGSPIRWAILAELSDGQPGMVLAIARKLDLLPVTVSQHMGVLRRAGIVAAGLGGLYTIAPQFMADAAQGHLDFGYCLLRLKKSDAPPAA